MNNNFHIKDEPNFKLYIPFKEKIKLESELNVNGINFYCSLTEQPMIEEGIRYFFLEKDRLIVDQIIKKNEILSGIESVSVLDYKDNKKIFSLFVKILVVLIILFLLAGGIMSL